MSSGIRFKWQGSHISIMTAFDADSPSAAITGITKADPAVVSYTGTAVPIGGVIYISGVLGMTEVNDKAFIVGAGSSAGSAKLHGVDSTGYTTYTSGGHFDVGIWSEFCELTNWNRTGASKTQIPATTICSDEEEFETGLPGQGSLALSFNYAPDTVAAQMALETWDQSGGVFGIRRQLPRNGGTRTYLGTVQQQSETAGNGGLWTATANVQLTGPFLYQAAA